MRRAHSPTQKIKFPALKTTSAITPFTGTWREDICLVESRTFAGAQLDEAKVRSEIWLLYGGYVVAWCCFVYTLQFVSPSTRVLSPWILPAFAAYGVWSIVSGALMRKKYFARTTVVAQADASKALAHWRLGNIIGFSSAITIAVLGFALKVLGATWKVTAIFFCIGLVFLLLWRPRPLLR